MPDMPEKNRAQRPAPRLAMLAGVCPVASHLVRHLGAPAEVLMMQDRVAFAMRRWLPAFARAFASAGAPQLTRAVLANNPAYPPKRKPREK